MGSISPQFGLTSLRRIPTNRQADVRVKLRLAKTYHSEPVLSTLMARDGLSVNILGALLGGNGQEDGWFDLHLKGPVHTICDALCDLAERDVDIWLGFESTADF